MINYKKELIDNEIKKEEALKRMKTLNLHHNCIEAFNERNEVWISEMYGTLFDLSQKQYIIDEIKHLQDMYKILVYHCILTKTEFGTLITMFYVSNEKEEWEYDNDDLLHNCSCCYVLNLEDDLCSEFGTIGFKKINGGLIRIL